MMMFIAENINMEGKEPLKVGDVVWVTEMGKVRPCRIKQMIDRFHGVHCYNVVNIEGESFECQLIEPISRTKEEEMNRYNAD